MLPRGASFVLSLLSIATAANAAPAPGSWQQVFKQKLAEQAVATLLDNQLPLKLDARAAYPTVAVLPGGPFHPLPLQLTADTMNEPLPRGDYVVQALAFCSEYSVHRPGAGVAYEIAPIQGKAAPAIATLLRRGTIEKHRSPHELQAVSWAIQSGLTYAKLPKTYQAIIDDVVPEYRNQLGGDFIQNLEDLYQVNAKAAGLPPLEKLLASMGKPGELALSANRQRQALLRQNTSDQIRDQVLFAGQESRVAVAPVKAEEGPWTVKIPGVAYIRYRVVGGNMATNNEIQIRILPQLGGQAGKTAGPKVFFASYQLPRLPGYPMAQTTAAANSSPSLSGITSGNIGYSVSRGAQALYFVPTPAPGDNPPPAGSVGKAGNTKGGVTITHDGVTKPLSNSDPISMGDTITTNADSSTQITFADGTQLTIGGSGSLTIDDFVYNPATTSGHESYNWLSGAFEYTSGLIGKDGSEDRMIQTEYGTLGIRGTKFLAQYNAQAGNVEIALISGSVTVSPKQTTTITTFTAPVKIVFSPSEVTSSPLTQVQYNRTKTKLFP
jgi:hypothetical protein